MTLFNMNSHKAPGIDGYNAYFFKKVWHVIGADVILAIKVFFRTCHLPYAINSTLITLLPKSENASSMKEYRPIACCTILYKIISKVLANRLQLVLGDRDDNEPDLDRIRFPPDPDSYFFICSRSGLDLSGPKK